MARFIDVNQNLMLDHPHGFGEQWQPIVDTTGRSWGVPGSATERPSLTNVVQFLAFDQHNPNSIYSCVMAARGKMRGRCARPSRQRCGEQINSLYLLIAGESRKQLDEGLPEFCRHVRMACHLFQGIHSVTMSHNEAWHFIRLGTSLERADKDDPHSGCEVLHPAPLGERCGDALRRHSMGRRAEIGQRLRDVSQAVREDLARPGRRILLLDGEFPRAVRYCLGLADDSLHSIYRHPARRVLLQRGTASGTTTLGTRLRARRPDSASGPP
ncbi:MAG: alpha-E domain-containing protein [Ignavibacteriota bacterium]